VLERLLEEARGDDKVVGVVVLGSRGKGAFATERSDWDVLLVVREQRGERAIDGWEPDVSLLRGYV
jgi:predicted nucleotidyltransferase